MKPYPLYFIPLILLLAVGLNAGLIEAPEAALKRIYGPDATIEKENRLLTGAQNQAFADTLGREPGSRIVTWYVASKEGKVTGYAGLRTVRVRTKDATALYCITPEGALQSIQMVAFHEPREYLPPQRWLKTMEGKRLSDPVSNNEDIPNITGATLSANALTRTAKEMLLLWQLQFKE